jgi:hypothetical protein
MQRIPLKFILLLATGLLALTAILLTATSASATGEHDFFEFLTRRFVTWTPPSVTTTLAPGDTQTIPVSFITPRRLHNVVARVSPELAPYVQVEPRELPSVEEGTTVHLNLRISALPDALPGTIEGKIRLFREFRFHFRTWHGVRVWTFARPVFFAKPLPIEVTFSVVPVPPDPGEAGKATLAGIDSDGDGVRDDIQRYIVFSYQNSEKTRAVLLMQYAKSAQMSLLDADNKEASIQHTLSLQRAIECLYYIRPDDAEIVGGELYAQILNTDERSRAWIKAGQHVSGQVFTISDDFKSTCDFDPDTMEN